MTICINDNDDHDNHYDQYDNVHDENDDNDEGEGWVQMVEKGGSNICFHPWVISLHSIGRAISRKGYLLMRMMMMMMMMMMIM